MFNYTEAAPLPVGRSEEGNGREAHEQTATALCQGGTKSFAISQSTNARATTA
jgi:hypothetical protein